MGVEEEILAEVSKIRGVLMLQAPFISSLLMSCRVVVDEKVQVAAVDSKRTIYVSPKFLSLPKAERIYVVAHEALHLALRHAARCSKIAHNEFERYVYNFVADSTVNEILNMHGLTPPAGMVTNQTVSSVLGIPVGDVRNLTTEAKYRLFFNPDPKKPPAGLLLDLKPGIDVEHEEPGGEDRWDMYWREAISRATVVAKSVGKLPSGIERFFTLLKPKISWRRLLRELLTTGIGEKVVASYRKMSRKVSGLPGLVRLMIPNGWLLIDVSGSISDEEASQAASECYAVAREYRSTLRVVPWDTQPHDVFVLEKPEDIKRLKLRGGGGTEIASTLEMVYRKMSPLDFVVILTDGMIHDIETDRVQNIMMRIAVKASATVFVTTAEKPRLPMQWKLVEISL